MQGRHATMDRIGNLSYFTEFSKRKSKIFKISIKFGNLDILDIFEILEILKFSNIFQNFEIFEIFENFQTFEIFEFF